LQFVRSSSNDSGNAHTSTLSQPHANDLRVQGEASNRYAQIWSRSFITIRTTRVTSSSPGRQGGDALPSRRRPTGAHRACTIQAPWPNSPVLCLEKRKANTMEVYLPAAARHRALPTRSIGMWHGVDVRRAILGWAGCNLSRWGRGQVPRDLVKSLDPIPGYYRRWIADHTGSSHTGFRRWAPSAPSRLQRGKRKRWTLCHTRF
jgi:hypothetical protein